MFSVSAFAAVSEPARRRILELLRERERPVGELVEHLRLTQPGVSKHLRVLREARIVSEQRHGRERLYRLEPTELKEISDWILPYRSFWQVSLGNLKSYLENE